MSDFGKTPLNLSRMGTQPANETSLKPFQPYYGYTGVILGMFFFQITYKVVASFRAPKALSTTPELWKWRNLLVSWIHAVIISVWDLVITVMYPEMFDDLIDNFTWSSYWMVAFSTGYFFFDFVDIFLTKRALQSWEIVIHHICVGGMFFYNVVTGRCIIYTVVALWAEINSVFLHLRKLFQMARVDFNHWAYRINVYVNLVTFQFRFVAIGTILYGFLHWGNRVPVTYYWTLTACMVCMVPINIILFWRLFKNDILRHYFSSYKKTKDTSKEPLISSNNNLKENNHLVQTNHIKAE